MSLSGNLEDVSVADALQFIHLGGRTGTLTLDSHGKTAEIGFHQGRIVNAWGPESKRLGDLLLETGAIDKGTLEKALQIQAAETPRRSLGQILVAMNVIGAESMYRAVEQQIERTVYDLVTWTHGTFQFALDDLKPIDDIAVFPGDVVKHLNLDTQMVLLDALRIFDERNRGGEGESGAEKPGSPAQGGTAADEFADFAPHGAAQALNGTAAPGPSAGDSIAPRGSAAVSAAAAAAVAALQPDATAQKARVQVVTADRQLPEKLAQGFADEAVVARVTLREAGTPPPGEAPPLVVLDLRQNGVPDEAIQALRRSRPRAALVAIVDPSVALVRAFDSGVCCVVPPDLAVIGAAVRSVQRSRSDLAAGSARFERINANFAKLRRIVGDLRSGLISTTISLSLMNIISESVERAVLFLVRRDALVALGAFGTTAKGASLAQLTRGLRLPLEGDHALSGALNDGQVRSVKFEDGKFPEAFTSVVGRPRSGQCAVFPVMGGQRVIAVVYADNGPSTRNIEEIEILELAAAQAGLAFENELLRRQNVPPARE